MELHWLKREGAPSLVVFILGWAADHRWVEHICPRGFDVLSICDLRQLQRPALPEYRHKVLLAWSFGVWAAEQMFQKGDFNRALALCGSPLPMSDTYGLGHRRAKLTLRGLPGGLLPFYRAALGDSFHRFSGFLPPRPQETLVRELDSLIALSSQHGLPHMEWHQAVLGERDSIFPLANLLAYWKEKALLLPLPHYPFADATMVNRWIDG